LLEGKLQPAAGGRQAQRAAASWCRGLLLHALQQEEEGKEEQGAQAVVALPPQLQRLAILRALAAPLQLRLPLLPEAPL
jgi:hypothetical protein